ncbi:MAG: heme-binding protein [Natronospirillum sp.]
MHSKQVLSLTDARDILAGATAEAYRHNWPVTIAIVDDGGHLLAMQRMDGCPALSAYVATEKARTAALGRRETKVYEDMINQGRFAFLSAPQISATLEGGLPIFVTGQVAAAIGVSGVRPEQDAQVARAGIAALTAAMA